MAKRKPARQIKRLTVKNLDQEDLDRLKLNDDEDEPGWYINDPNSDMQWAGPYEAKAEATDDKQGLERFWREYRDEDYAAVDQGS